MSFMNPYESPNAEQAKPTRQRPWLNLLRWSAGTAAVSLLSYLATLAYSFVFGDIQDQRLYLIGVIWLQLSMGVCLLALTIAAVSFVGWWMNS
jgi:hypothetical protein